MQYVENQSALDLHLFVHVVSLRQIFLFELPMYTVEWTQKTARSLHRKLDQLYRNDCWNPFVGKWLQTIVLGILSNLQRHFRPASDLFKAGAGNVVWSDWNLMADFFFVICLLDHGSAGVIKNVFVTLRILFTGRYNGILITLKKTYYFTVIRWSLTLKNKLRNYEIAVLL